MIKGIAITIISALLLTGTAIAQDCFGIVNYCPKLKKSPYTYNGQSKSGAFAQGDTAEVTIVVYKNMEYRVSFCSPTHPDLNGKIEFVVAEEVTKPTWREEKVYETVEKYDDYGNLIGEEKIEKVVKKRVYNKTDVVRFDNKSNDLTQEWIFISDQTRKLKIKVYIPNLSGGGDSLQEQAYACVGLLIEHMPGPKIGFK